MGRCGICDLDELIIQRDGIAVRCAGSRARLGLVLLAGPRKAGHMVRLGASRRNTARARKRRGERTQVMRSVAGRVGIGDVLRKQPLPPVSPGQATLRQIEQADLRLIHAGRLRPRIEWRVNQSARCLQNRKCDTPMRDLPVIRLR
jgi:hypothetical protein